MFPLSLPPCWVEIKYCWWMRWSQLCTIHRSPATLSKDAKASCQSYIISSPGSLFSVTHAACGPKLVASCKLLGEETEGIQYAFCHWKKRGCLKCLKKTLTLSQVIIHYILYVGAFYWYHRVFVGLVHLNKRKWVWRPWSSFTVSTGEASHSMCVIFFADANQVLFTLQIEAAWHLKEQKQKLWLQEWQAQTLQELLGQKKNAFLDIKMWNNYIIKLLFSYSLAQTLYIMCLLDYSFDWNNRDNTWIKRCHTDLNLMITKIM